MRFAEEFEKVGETRHTSITLPSEPFPRVVPHLGAYLDLVGALTLCACFQQYRVLLLEATHAHETTPFLEELGKHLQLPRKRISERTSKDFVVASDPWQCRLWI
jgi:hypothetical protein